MNIYSFLLLKKEDKALAVSYGDCVFIRREPGFRYLLYHMGSFFVEVQCDLNDMQIHRFIPFKNDELLDPYLANISFTEINHLLQ